MFPRLRSTLPRRRLLLSTLAATTAVSVYAYTRPAATEEDSPDAAALYFASRTLRLEQPKPVGSDTDRLSSTWTPPTRTEMLNELKGAKKGGEGEFDLMIVGGGATGAGIAVDAASRGLRVALVERDDFSSG